MIFVFHLNFVKKVSFLLYVMHFSVNVFFAAMSENLKSVLMNLIVHIMLFCLDDPVPRIKSKKPFISKKCFPPMHTAVESVLLLCVHIIGNVICWPSLTLLGNLLESPQFGQP